MPVDPMQELDRRREEEQRAVREAGGGEAEGFEQSEELLIEHASHGDEHAARHVLQDAFDEEKESPPDDQFGEADEQLSSELHEDRD